MRARLIVEFEGITRYAPHELKILQVHSICIVDFAREILSIIFVARLKIFARCKLISVIVINFAIDKLRVKVDEALYCTTVIELFGLTQPDIHLTFGVWHV